MGESVSEGIVSRWLKAVGDTVDEGEPVVEVTTDKVDVEVPAPATGRLTEIVAAEGETVAVGATLAVIAPGPAAVPATAPTPEPAVVETEAVASAPTPEPAVLETEAEAPAPNVPEPALAQAPPSPPPLPAALRPTITSDNSDVAAAPLARRAAAKNGVDLHAVPGSGPGGHGSKGDVLVARRGGGPRQDPTVRVVDGEHAEPIRGPAA